MITLNPLQIHPTLVMLVKVEEEEEVMVNREVMAKTNQEEEEEAGDSKVAVVVEEEAMEVAKVKINFLHETNYNSSYPLFFINYPQTVKLCHHTYIYASLFAITMQKCSKYQNKIIFALSIPSYK